MDRMADKVALVTGGSSGIGRATALAFARGGARVVIAARGLTRGEAVVREIEDLGGTALFIPTDMSKAADITALIQRTVQNYGKVDIAVNSAGTVTGGLTAELSEEAFDQTVAVNLRGVWLVMKYEIKQMLIQGGGTIVNISSVNGLIGTPGASAYAASKHGVTGLSKSAALEYARSGIRINTVCPGAFRTPMLEGIWEQMSPGEPEKAEARYSERVPMGRVGRPEEVAEAIVWLCSDAASYVTGAVLTVDGGLAAGAA